MTSKEKKDIYTMLEKASCWAYGYDSPTFKDDDILFEDDVYEYIETQEQIPQDAESINLKPEKISTAEEEISRLEILATACFQDHETTQFPARELKIHLFLSLEKHLARKTTLRENLSQARKDNFWTKCLPQ